MRGRLRARAGSAAASFPLDGFSPTIALSTRRLFTAFTSALLRIRSSVAPNNEVDVFPDSNGGISLTSAVSPVSWGATLGAFATDAGGLNSTGNATVRWWYNQGTLGATGDVGNATAGNQPFLMESGAFSADTTIGTQSRAALKFVRGFAPLLGTTGSLASTDVFASNQSTASIVHQLLEDNASFTSIPVGMGIANTANRWGVLNTQTTRRFDFGNDTVGSGRLSGTAPTPLAAEYMVYRRDGASGLIRRNGSDLATSATLSAGFTNGTQFRAPDSTAVCQAKMAEAIVFPAAPDVSVIEASQASWFGI